MIEIVNSPNGNRFRIVKKVAENKEYKIYLCIQEGTKRQCLLQIATVAKCNGDLQRAAYILEKLALHAEKLEEEYENVKTDPKVLLNYQLGFPELVDNFICSEHGNRQTNILAFRNVENVADMLPLMFITEKFNKRIDLRTSAWIMGKALKMLDFVHVQGISVNLMTGKNILIDPNQHYVVIFDLSKAVVLEKVPVEVQGRDKSQAARAVIIALGGRDRSIEDYFPSLTESEKEYIKFLEQLASEGTVLASGEAHKEFYRIVDQAWERELYPFTVKPLE